MEEDQTHWLGPEPSGSARRVYLGILRDLESGRMVPGQRVVETDLSQHYQVGRNAVREAMQHLTVRGVIDLSRNRSPAIRQLDLAESMEVLDVASAMMRLAARAAAIGYSDAHRALLDEAITHIDSPPIIDGAVAFSSARRQFYRALLMIGANRELQRLFPAIGMHIIHAQYPLPMLQQIRQQDYRAIAAAVQEGAADRAEALAAAHVDNVRTAIRAAVRG